MVKSAILFFMIFLFTCQAQAGTKKLEVCNWKDDHMGALSISVDDSCLSCAFLLTRNNFKGTYFLVSPPSRKLRIFNFPVLNILHRLGHEIGAHTVNHPIATVSASYMEKEVKDNIREITIKVGIPEKDIISLAWPGGYVQHKGFISEYFLSARAYNINAFEEITPLDFMNLKSFNSHQHEPFPPQDFKAILDEAESKGKWAIFAFHKGCNDDGAINYAKKKDLWVAPVGTVVKYILQRNNVKIEGSSETSEGISFIISRSGIASTPVRNFEESFRLEDTVTLKIDIDDERGISAVQVDGKTTGYKIKMDNNNKYLLLNIPVYADRKKSVEINYLGIKAR